MRARWSHTSSRLHAFFLLLGARDCKGFRIAQEVAGENRTPQGFKMNSRGENRCRGQGLGTSAALPKKVEHRRCCHPEPVRFAPGKLREGSALEAAPAQRDASLRDAALSMTRPASL